ncbi:MAG TPA: TraM recognition domain-containing protein [Streptosporangiaceae bacterium]|nr:TraM recognition domain-containing protein [Streptosporangiaceae bacterium]
MSLDERSKGSILSGATNAFAAYRLSGALATTENPNFDPAEFAAGDPSGFNPYRAEAVFPDTELNPLEMLHRDRVTRCISDTVYLTASSERQELVAPLVAGLLSQIREATFAQHRKDEEQDNFDRPAVLWALDEVARIAPMGDLPQTLSQSGGQGLLVAACLQDLKMARIKWEKAADSFLTLFGHVVVHPGIRDKDTLQAISTVIGKHWVKSASTSTSRGRSGGQSRGWSESSQTTSNQQLVERLEPGAIAQGRASEHPHYVLMLTTTGWAWGFCTPYYQAPPWPQLLVGAMEYAAYRADRNAAAALVELGKRRSEILDEHETDRLVAGYDGTWTNQLSSPVRSFIPLRKDPGRQALAELMEAQDLIRAGTDEGATPIPVSMANIMTAPLRDVAGKVRPDWVMWLGPNSTYLRLVSGGLEAKAASDPSFGARWGAQTPGAEVPIEAWSRTCLVRHMTTRLVEVLAELSATCVITTDQVKHHGRRQDTPDSLPAAATA